MVSIKKMSKKKQKEFYSAKRNTWDINPSTRVSGTPKGAKGYNRNSKKAETKHEINNYTTRYDNKTSRIFYRDIKF